MNKMNFSTLWRKWIMECVSIASTSVQVNECLTNEFKFERGVRQGDYLSHLLFLINVEGLTLIIDMLEWRPIFIRVTNKGG